MSVHSRLATVLDHTLGDLRVAFRQLARRPLYATLGIGTLALGIGGTVALASVGIGLFVRPLPVADPARLQVFWSDYNWRGVEFDAVRDTQRAFDDVAAFSFEGYTLALGDRRVTVLAGIGSAGIFDVAGVRPLIGRTFRAGDDRPGAAPITVISHSFWQQEMGGDPNVLGRLIEIDGAPVEIVGVLPRGFFLVTPEARIWRPLMLDPADRAYHGNGWLVLLGRERRDATPAAVAADVQAIARMLGERFTYPAAWDKTRNAHLTPLTEYTLGEVKPAVLLLQLAAVLVLVIACANVAALVLSRTSDRAAELALRAALGAGHGRLVRQIAAESLAMAALASLLGGALAAAGFGVLVARLPLPEGLEQTLAVDWSMLAVATALSVVVSLVVALAPARAIFRDRLLAPTRLRSGGRATAATGRLQHALVAVEVGLAVLLVAGATLLTRSVNNLYAIDPGFSPVNVAALDLVAPTQIMNSGERGVFLQQVAERSAQLPGVAASGFITRLPLRDGGWQGTLSIEARPDLSEGREPNALFRIVTPGYFPTMQIEIAHGRTFTPDDHENSLPVAIVSESFARQMWPGRDPLGQRVRHGFAREPRWVTVVGVAEESRMLRMTGENPFVLYVPLAQSSAPEGPVLVVRGAGGPPPLAAVQALVREIDPRIAIGRVTTLDEVVATTVAEPLRLRFFLSLTALLAFVIGAVGIYSVVSYSVTRRRAEFGVRLALGANPGRIAADVVRGGLIPVAVGAVAGLAATAAVGATIGRFLYGVSAIDLASLSIAALSLLAAGACATALPALRAGRTDPVRVLRAD